MFENYVILEEVDWEWLILKKIMYFLKLNSRELHDSRWEKAQFSLTQLYPIVSYHIIVHPINSTYENWKYKKLPCYIRQN